MKKPIVLLHGALGAQVLFTALKKELSNEFEVFTFDFSGHGKVSFSEEGFGIEVFAKELQDFITSNELVNVPIFGYSMGGYVALYLAATASTDISKIITLGTKFEWTPESAAHETARMNPEVMEEKIPAYTQSLQQRHGNEWKQLVYQTAGMMIDLGESPLLGTEELAKIKQKVYVLRGEQDHMVSKAESEKTVQQIPSAEYFELEHIPHPLEKTDPKLLAKEIRFILNA